MIANIWKKIQQKTKVWREVALPGVSIIGLVILAHLTGLLQLQEWTAFDDLLRLRPPETVDTRVVIVGIDESDIKFVGGFPVPDSELAKMLRILQTYKPRVIGLDIFRARTSNPGWIELSQALREIPNVIGVEVALNRQKTFNVKPPPELPLQRVGFADVIVDSDGKLRRSILASTTWEGKLKCSLPLRLAAAYLRSEGIILKHSTHSYDPIQFASTKLPHLLPNSGGYVRADMHGNQVLLNFRSNQKPFRTIHLRDIITKQVDPNWIRGQIIIIGMTAPSVKDTFITSAVKNTLFTSALGNLGNTESPNQLIYGVEVHAHATSQIISKVLDGRIILNVWSNSCEYLWIASWGLFGIALGLILQSAWKTLISVGLASIGLVVICYIFLILGWWIPVVPTLLALSGAGLTTSFFNRDLRSLLEQRSLTLQRTFEAIHNGPLQNLAVILRSIGEEDLSTDQLQTQLQKLNQELRCVHDSLRQEMLTRSDSLYLESNLVLDLKAPITELLYQVYDITLKRSFKGFTTIVTYIPPNFKPLEDCYLSMAQKRGLCLFLQEALCNVGKHAVGATCLDVICTCSRFWYSLRIIDNGAGTTPLSNYIGRQGTEQAQKLARQMSGKFRRLSNTPQGTICELTWPVKAGILLNGKWMLSWLLKIR